MQTSTGTVMFESFRGLIASTEIDEKTRFLLQFVESQYDEIKADGKPTTAESLRKKLNRSIVQTVLKATGADCGFIRRVNTDKSATLADEPVDVLYRNDHMREVFGIPPRIKLPNLGVSTYFIARNVQTPRVVADINLAEEELKEAHRKSAEIARQKGDYDVRFFKSIVGEVYIPLVIEGEIFACIIGVKASAFPAEKAEGLENDLASLQRIFSFFYYSGLQILNDSRQSTIHEELPRIISAIETSPDVDSMLRKIASFLTCEPGLQWHRAMIFVFEKRYPSDAVCVLGLGSNGEDEWSVVQAGASEELKTVQEYFIESEMRRYGEPDALFQYTTQSPKLRVSKESLFEQNELIEFFGKSLDPIADFGEDLDFIFKVNSSEDSAESKAEFKKLFHVSGRASTFWLFPLLASRRQKRTLIGFVVLNNVYPRFVETRYSSGLTRHFCDCIANLLYDQGAGASGWVENLYRERTSLKNLLDRYGEQSVVEISDEFKRMMDEMPLAHFRP